MGKWLAQSIPMRDPIVVAQLYYSLCPVPDAPPNPRDPDAPPGRQIPPDPRVPPLPTDDMPPPIPPTEPRPVPVVDPPPEPVQPPMIVRRRIGRGGEVNTGPPSMLPRVTPRPGGSSLRPPPLDRAIRARNQPSRPFLPPRRGHPDAERRAGNVRLLK
jgi:hypothetical protein